MMQNKKILFVSGLARSGTSAMVKVLNRNPDFLIGQERYFFLVKRETITPAEFERDRFLTFQTGDSHITREASGVEKRQQAYDRAAYVGDKFPLLFNHFDYVFRNFPDAQHVYIFRNPLSVVESYDARQRNPKDPFRRTWKEGLEEWNTSVGRVANLSDEQLSRFHLIEYESFFESADQMNNLFARLGAPSVDPAALDVYVQEYLELREKLVPRRDDIRQYVALNADVASYRKLHERAIAQRGGAT